MAVLRNDDGPYFFGDLVTDGNLCETEIERKRSYNEISVSRSDQERYICKGWEFKKEVKNTVFLRKEKDKGELLEDEVWLLFKNMGFKEMNRDRCFEIKNGVIKKQIDVFAKDDNNVFIIECKTGTPNLLNDIHAILNSRRDITISIKKKYGKDFRVSFILVTKNIEWTESEERLATSNENNCFFFWKEDDLEAYKTIVDQLGDAAKYQLYGLLFPNKESSEVREIKVPAMRGGKGKKKYYCFLIQPENLFKIAYVHRREKSKPQEVKKSYQRMVSKKRIEKIGEFIDKGNQFPNNIIINFNKKPQFEPNTKVGETLGISYGILKFPPYYGCAWIIDGQHRLYGYSKSEHASDVKHTIPVIAFESLDVKGQANLFVDINQEQKSVNKNLLWDLYPDIYEGSDDKEQNILRAISLTAKKLNSDEDSIFFERVQIPSILIKDKKKTNLTLTTLCEAIKENKLIEEENMLFKNNYEMSVDYATERIKAFFDVTANFLQDDWNKGNKGLIRSNNGIRIFLIIFRQLLRDLNYKGDSCYRKQNLSDFKEVTLKRLQPVLDKLKAMDGYKLSEIRQASNKKLVMMNTQKILWEMYQDDNFGAELWFNGGWTPGAPDDDQKIEKLIDDTEIKLRSILVQKLKEKYGDQNWYKQGIPGGVKDKIKDVVERDSSLLPWIKNGFESLSPEDKVNLTFTSSIREVIINDANWELFINTFAKDKECTSVQFRFFEALRNKYKHHRELDDVGKGLGYYGMRWIRKCLGIDTSKEKDIKLNF